MGGTNNPSEEQIELVQSRVIELAQSLADEASMLDANAYFDECGFDIESRGQQLSAKIKQYCEGAEDLEDLEPSIDDHPQPRRMARYLLENIDIEILEKPLSADLVKSKPAVSVTAIKSTGGGGDEAMIFGYPRNLVIALIVVLLLMAGAIGFVVMKSSGGGAPIHVGGGGGGRGGKGKGWRNRSIEGP